MSYIQQLLANRILITGLVGWAVAQVVKTVLYAIVNRTLNFERLVGDGGMPSSHTATVVSLAVAAGLQCGWDSAVFAVAAVLAFIVMHDAVGVKQETGKQARVINSMLELWESMGRGDLTPEETLKEFVGHTRGQVYAGAAFGALIAFVINYV